MQLTPTTDLNLLSVFLIKEGILNKDENINVIEKPGEGNMNMVLRIITNRRSIIAKQSKPFVQKYPYIAAPINRIKVEHTFYKTIENSAISNHFPQLFDFLPEHYILFLEDLGESKDFSFIYNERKIVNSHLEQLVTIAKGIHKSKSIDNYPENIELRKLNHEHIFVLPFLEDNGFSLDSIQKGLQEISLPLKKDNFLREKATQLGKLYLSNGNVLLHGDYYPGSWMLNDDNIFILDPEFSFKGPAEFDVAVMIAHIFMTTGNPKIYDQIIELYNTQLDNKLVKEFAGIEVIRRLIGLAQLPLNRSLLEKEQLLNVAKHWILD